METQLRNCPLCRKNSQSIIYAESTLDQRKLNEFSFASRKLPEYMNHKLSLCTECDLVYASEIEGIDDLGKEYANAAFDSQSESAYAATTYFKLIRKVIKRLPDLNGAIDIGTGDGAFLVELVTAGFVNVIGFEPSSAPVLAAKPAVRPLIKQQMFGSEDLAKEQYSLVSCFQTIEHVDSPLELCKESIRILKPGGVVVIIGHNRRGIVNRILGRKSPIFDIEHLQLFSPLSLKKMLSLAGFESVSVGSFWNKYPLSYWVRLFPFPPILKKLLLRGLSITAIGRLSIALPVGNLIAIGYKKI
jgi:SAM-dependent methyltransferase